MHPPINDSVYIPLTSEGRGAISSIWISGPRTLSILNERFTPRSHVNLAGIAAGELCLGRWIHTNSPEHVSGEEAILVALDSATFEIHVHGGNQSRQSILEALDLAGLSKLTIAEYYDLCQFDSITQLAQSHLMVAETEVAALLLLAQPGAWSQWTNEMEHAKSIDNREMQRELVDQVMKWSELGRHLTVPWKVTIFGPPNVGKSSIINALTGFSRAIVHHVPGTTRDTVGTRMVIEGWLCEVTDTAGIREPESDIEAQGISRAWAALESANCRIAVFDATVPWTDCDGKLLIKCRPHLVVFNKLDLVDPCNFQLPMAFLSQLESLASPPKRLLVSATTGKNIDSLQKSIARSLVPTPPSYTQAIPLKKGTQLFS